MLIYSRLLLLPVALQTFLLPDDAKRNLRHELRLQFIVFRCIFFYLQHKKDFTTSRLADPPSLQDMLFGHWRVHHGVMTEQNQTRCPEQQWKWCVHVASQFFLFLQSAPISWNDVLYVPSTRAMFFVHFLPQCQRWYFFFEASDLFVHFFSFTTVHRQSLAFYDSFLNEDRFLPRAQLSRSSDQFYWVWCLLEL